MGLGKASKEVTEKAREQEQERNANRSGVNLPDGLYSLAITEHSVMTSKAGQAMAVIKVAPCVEDSQSKTADLAKEMPIFIMGQDIEDNEKFAADTRAKLVAAAKKAFAEENGVSVDDAPEPDITNEDVAEKVRDRLAFAHSQAVKNAKAIFGVEELPEVPRWDREQKAFFFKDGTSTDKAGKEKALAEADSAAVDMLNEALDGERDIVGYVVYGMVRQETYNGKTESKVKYIKEKLNPERDSLVPTSKWAD